MTVQDVKLAPKPSTKVAEWLDYYTPLALPEGATKPESAKPSALDDMYAYYEA